jgi:hypothetical protein
MGEETFRFAGGPLSVDSEQLTAIALQPDGDVPPDVKPQGASIHFFDEGWFEILLTVEWDTSVTDGTRFAHTNIPDVHPLHSEAIDANVLARISDGRQLLRANTIFSPEGPSEIVVEVWHDAGRPVEVRRAELAIRSLD